MPHLNWRSEEVFQKVSPHAKLQSEFVLELNPTQRDLLAIKLEEVYQAQDGELRLDLNRNWILFWKVKESESRLLLSHPEAEEWVATAALQLPHGQALISQLRELVPGECISLSSIAPVSSVSNVEISLVLRTQ